MYPSSKVWKLMKLLSSYYVKAKQSPFRVSVSIKGSILSRVYTCNYHEWQL